MIKIKRAVIYARVSTDEQDENQQVKPCIDYAKEQGFEVVNVYKEKASAYKKGGKYRLQYNSMMDAATKDKFEHIIVWNFDRMFRNHLQGVQTIRSFSKPPYNIKFHFLNNIGIWTQINSMEAPLNHMMFDFLLHYESWRSEAESKTRSERVKKAYQFNSKKWGRPPVSNYIKRKVLSLRKQKYSMDAIADKVKVSKTTVHKIITANTNNKGVKK